MNKNLVLLLLFGAILAGLGFYLFAGGKNAEIKKGSFRERARTLLACVLPGKRAPAAVPQRAAPAPVEATPPASVAGIKLSGIIISAKPAVLLNFNGREFSFLVGDERELAFPEGPEAVRCEKIEGGSVWLYFPRNGARAELQIAQPINPGR